jgi:hypothetical protein
LSAGLVARTGASTLNDVNQRMETRKLLQASGCPWVKVLVSERAIRNPQILFTKGLRPCNFNAVIPSR